MKRFEEYIAIIRKSQLPDGGFLSLSSSNPKDFSGAREYITTFFTANILACLTTLPKASDICEKAADFLLRQKSATWSFNYWATGSGERTTMPYPDDLDDTFVALAALYNYDSSLIDGGALARIARLLAAVEVVPGGPYRTWLVQPDAPEAWRDIDIAVNSNIGHFLSLVGIYLPNIELFVDERIAQGNLRSPYYPSVVPVIYFISRFYRGAQKAALVDILLHEQKHSCNPLENAMASTALTNFGSPELVTGFLAATEERETRPYAFCIDPARDGKIQYAGTPALTAAFLAEAFAKYRFGIASSPAFADQTRLERTKKLAIARCTALPANLKASASVAIEEIKDEEIVAMPYLMQQAIQAALDDRILDELALANLYGWIAYSIYDDILDREEGSGGLSQLPVANFFLRSLTDIYVALDTEIPGIGALYKKIMDGIDEANICEQLDSRIPIEHLADRSMGHALPAITVLLAAGYASDSREVRCALSLFRNYLIARQLHDDAHDWREDLARGRVTAVAARLLGVNEPEKFFWREMIPGIIADIKTFLNRARAELARLTASGVIKDPAPFEALLDRLAASADRTMQERDEAKKFIAAY